MMTTRPWRAHRQVFASAETLCHVPPDALVAHLDAGTLHVPSTLAVPSLPANAHQTLLSALETFRAGHTATPPSPAAAPPSAPPRTVASPGQPAAAAAASSVAAAARDDDLAFPARALGDKSAETADAEPVAAQQLMVRHAFASFFAHLLRGYQGHLIVAPDRSPPNLAPAGPEAAIDVGALLSSRAPAEAALLRLLLDTQGFVRFIEQRVGWSSRDSEFVLFDGLADQCARAHASGAPPSLPSLPALPPLSRVYTVPPPVEVAGASYGAPPRAKSTHTIPPTSASHPTDLIRRRSVRALAAPRPASSSP